MKTKEEILRPYQKDIGLYQGDIAYDMVDHEDALTAMQEYSDQQLAECTSLFKESIMRCQIAFPTTEEELKWFEEGCHYDKSDFLKRLYNYLRL